jgi:AraC-like DNA-binding protein
VYENKFNLPHLYHFAAPFLLVTFFGLTFFVSNELGDVLKKIFFIIAILSYFTYAYLIYKLLYKNIWNRKSEINAVQQQNDIIKKWSFFLFFFFLTVLLFRFIIGIVSDKPGYFNNDLFWVTALIWSSAFVKIILTPEILYGYNFLNKTIDEAADKVVLSSIWKLNGPVQPITSEKDKKLEEKMLSLLPEYIHKIEELSFHSETFRKQELSMEDIASTLKVPLSHLNFLFKYHCKESFTDYKKIVRIHDATKLLEGGYLNTNTIESLSTAVGFSSYNTFYVAFKSITGITTQDYVKRK